MNILLQDKRVDSSIDNNFAIKVAVLKNHVEIMNILLQDERVGILTGNNIFINIDIKNPIPNTSKEYFKNQMENEECYNAFIVLLYDSLGQINIGKDHITEYIYSDQQKNNNILKLLQRDINLQFEKAKAFYTFESKFRDDEYKRIYKLGDHKLVKITNLYNASKNGYQALLELLLKDIFSSEDINNSMLIACLYGHVNIVENLLKHPLIEPDINNNYAVKVASRLGYVDIVEFLIKDGRVNATANSNSVIRLASMTGQVNIVKYLLKNVQIDPSDDNSSAIRLAVLNHHTAVIKLLLLLDDGRSNTGANNNFAIRTANIGRLNDIKRILGDNNVKVTSEDIWCIDHQIYNYNTLINRLQKDVSFELPSISFKIPWKVQNKRSEEEVLNFLWNIKDINIIGIDDRIDRCYSSICRPDCLIKVNTYHIIVEIDEFQHKRKEYSNECTHMKEIAGDISSYVLFIRYNPDGYNGLIEKISSKRLIVLKDLLLHYINDVPNLDGNYVIKLFYDGWDGTPKIENL